MTDRCAVPGCRGEVELVYLEHGICDLHWTELNADDASRETLRMVLGLDATTPPAMEADMSENENTIPAAENAAPEVAMATKKTETKAPKKTRTAKAAKPTPAKKATRAAKPAKAPKPKKERPPKEPVGNRTFAVRISDDELAAIHKAAGPRNATRLARAVLAAFANADSKAFGRVLEEAAKARG